MKTFKRRSQWISELDTAIVSYDILRNIYNFNVHQTDWLPSDHAPISFEINVPKVSLNCLLSRACNLGGHGSLMRQAAHVQLVNRPVGYSQINIDDFSNAIVTLPMPNMSNNDVNILATNLSESLYDCVKSCRNNTHANHPRNMTNIDVSAGRLNHLHKWDQLLKDPNDARVWKAIDWKGQFTDNINCNSPSDRDFKQFYDDHIKDYSNELNQDVSDTPYNVNIPLLDNTFIPDEVISQVNKMEADKSCGLDGIPPGVYKHLTMPWILLITSLFNLILTSGSYPLSWSKAKLFMLFKRGNRMDPNNYRGISVINSIAKIFDMVLCNRLEQWFKPYREQAGAQKGRGCLEHIVTLRLLTDYAKKKKRKLFIIFVDFKKAYDLVPRHILLSILRRLGCGAAMLGVIAAMYSVTQNVIGTAIITTVIGVRQGSPTSCLLFILYVNDLIKLIKDTCEPDGFFIMVALINAYG